MAKQCFIHEIRSDKRSKSTSDFFYEENMGAFYSYIGIYIHSIAFGDSINS